MNFEGHNHNRLKTSTHPSDPSLIPHVFSFVIEPLPIYQGRTTHPQPQGSSCSYISKTGKSWFALPIEPMFVVVDITISMGKGNIRPSAALGDLANWSLSLGSSLQSFCSDDIAISGRQKGWGEWPMLRQRSRISLGFY